MKLVFSLFLLVFIFKPLIRAQDLIIADNNDSILCRITKIDEDSAVYFKTQRKYKPYNGYLKREYYNGIVKDYYTDLKREQNPGKSLYFISFGAHYTLMTANPVIDMVVQDERLKTELSGGISWSISVQKFSNPLNSLGRSSGPAGNMSYGFSFESFSRSAASDNLDSVDLPEFDIQKQMKTFTALLSYNTEYRYSTYLVLKPGIRFNHFRGHYNNLFLKSQSMSFVLGMSIHQKILEIRDHLSLFLHIDPFLHTTKSGKIEYDEWSYVNNVYYNNVLAGFGFSAGLSLRCFL